MIRLCLVRLPHDRYHGWKSHRVMMIVIRDAVCLKHRVNEGHGRRRRRIEGYGDHADDGRHSNQIGADKSCCLAHGFLKKKFQDWSGLVARSARPDVFAIDAVDVVPRIKFDDRRIAAIDVLLEGADRNVVFLGEVFAKLGGAAMRRELVPALEVERLWSGEWMQLRSRVLAVPSRLRQLLPHLSIDDIEMIDGELRRMLTEFGNDQ